VRNPIEAGMCASPFDARWTSFAATAGLAPAPSFLRVAEILDHSGPNQDETRQRYTEFVLGPRARPPSVRPIHEIDALAA
jgi:hypothetical protein